MFPKRETTPRRSLHTPREQPLFAPTRENPQATAKIQDTQYTSKQACLLSLKSNSKVLMEKPEQTPQCRVPAPVRQPPPRCWFTGNPAAGSCVSPADTGPLPGVTWEARPPVQPGTPGRSGPFTASRLETAVDELGECVKVCVSVLPDRWAGHHTAPGNTAAAEGASGAAASPYQPTFPQSLSRSVWGLHVCV